MRRSLTSHFLRDRRGTTVIEYALIASFVSVALVGILATLGSTVKTVFYDKLATLF